MKMFTAGDAQAKVIQAQEAEEVIKEEKRIAEEKQLEKDHQLAEERVKETLTRALKEVTSAAKIACSSTKFKVGHHSGSPDRCISKLVELVMEKLTKLNYRVENTSSDSKESTETAHYKAHVWRYEITIYWD